MAVGRLSVSAGRKGMASPHAMYIAREGKYAKPDDDLEKLEAVGVGNMPEWAKDKPNFFWKMSDEHERANGTAYREHVISLPRELSAEQRHDLILDWIAEEIGDKHAYQYAIHNPPAADGMEQPHCHLMFCERELDGIERAPDEYFKRYNSKNPEKGGARKANTGMKPADRKADLLAQRERWEQTCNKHLELADTKTKISMKSYKERGLVFKSLNYEMKDRNKPDLIATQNAASTATSEFRAAFADYKKLNIREEINNLNRAAEYARQQELERQQAAFALQQRQAQARAQAAALAAIKDKRLELPTMEHPKLADDMLISKNQSMHELHDKFANSNGSKRDYIEFMQQCSATVNYSDYLLRAKTPFDNDFLASNGKLVNKIDTLLENANKYAKDAGFDNDADVIAQQKSTDKTLAGAQETIKFRCKVNPAPLPDFTNDRQQQQPRQQQVERDYQPPSPR